MHIPSPVLFVRGARKRGEHDVVAQMTDVVLRFFALFLFVVIRANRHVFRLVHGVVRGRLQKYGGITIVKRRDKPGVVKLHGL
jgi:hypothetical protein